MLLGSTSNDRVIDESRIGEDLKGNVRDLLRLCPDIFLGMNE
jgi:hypothetical protein